MPLKNYGFSVPILMQCKKEGVFSALHCPLWWLRQLAYKATGQRIIFVCAAGAASQR
jgi:hypothetical protein